MNNIMNNNNSLQKKGLIHEEQYELNFIPFKARNISIVFQKAKIAAAICQEGIVILNGNY